MYVGINQLKPGCRVYESVCDEKGRILIRAGVTLEAAHIDKLKQLGFKGIYIETELTKKGIISERLSPRIKANISSNLKPENIKLIVQNAKGLVDDILSRKAISINYVDIKTSDNELLEHSIAVAESSVIIGKVLRLNQDQLTDLAVAALLHDIGKLFVEKKYMSKISNKGLKETDQYSESSHPLYGFLFLKDSGEVNARIYMPVLTHHINKNRTGTTGSTLFDTQIREISPYSDIIHVADEFDIKKNTPNLSPSEALEYMLTGCGTLFDEKVFNAFINSVVVFLTGAVVILSNGLKGIVVGQNSGLPLRPKIIMLNTGQGFITGQEVDLANENFLNITIKSIEDEPIPMYEENSTYETVKAK